MVGFLVTYKNILVLFREVVNKYMITFLPSQNHDGFGFVVEVSRKFCIMCQQEFAMKHTSCL